MLLDLESELPLWDAARFFVLRDTTPAVVQHHVLNSPFHHSRTLSTLVAGATETIEIYWASRLLRRSTGASVCARRPPPEVIMLRHLMASATILTARQQDTTVDLASKPRIH